jgi:hypothetical protein
MPPTDPFDLETVHRNVLSYRKLNPTTKRLPPNIWSQILPLLQAHPLTYVATVLKLGQSTLARRAQKAKGLPGLGPQAFLEISRSGQSTCRWELEFPGGIKLRGFS